MLSLFVKHQFRISAIASVCAYQNEILVGKNAETSVIACFKLISEIGGLGVEESGFHTTQKWVLEIYINADSLGFQIAVGFEETNRIICFRKSLNSTLDIMQYQV